MTTSPITDRSIGGLDDIYQAVAGEEAIPPTVTRKLTLAEITRAVKDTGSMAGAARKLGVRWHTIRDRLAKAGIEVPKGKGGARPTVSDEQLVYLYRMTGSTGQMSAATGLHGSGIQRRLKRLGLELTGSGYYRDPLAGLR
jgi:hypothetical protein